MPEKSKNDKILDFMNTFAPQWESDNTTGKEEKEVIKGEDLVFGEQTDFDYDRNELAYMDITLYTEPDANADTESRIERLQEITQGIEQMVVKLEDVQTHKQKPASSSKRYKIDYRNSLNDGQYLATTTTKGPLLVIAGAGSGKTRTVTYRVSYLIESGVPPEQILLLTFTRKAASEMIKRTAELLQDNSVDKVMRGTFHAFANHTLRRFANMIGLSSNFTIIDTIDSQDIIDLIRQELKFTKKSRAFPRKSRIQSIFSKARNCNISIKEVLDREYTALLEFEDDLNLIFQAFQQYKRANNVVDYDDLMDTLRDKLRENVPFRRKVQSLHRYIMVDEFQDTNVVQKQIIDYIAQGSRNIMVVGDDSQSIYAFRGANFENILMFPKTYPDCKVVKLEQNYRSNQDILNFTNNVAGNARLGYQKRLFSTNKKIFKPLIARFYDQQDEAEHIVNKILELREKDISLNQIAVIYRASFHSNYIQAELLKRNIPYVVVGGIKFIERRHVKDIMAYLRIVLNPYDAVAWNRILKLIPGVGKITASKIIKAIQEKKGNIDFSSFEKRKYGDYLTELQNMLLNASREDITIATKIDIIKSYYEPLLQMQEDDYQTRIKDVDILSDLGAKYDQLDKFLSDFALDPPNNKFQDQVRPLIDESEDKPITLTTVHSSKGLEWYCVFVPHLLDGLFPSSRALKNIDYLEEERRLFYVAASRAKEQLYLTMPSYFSNWDQYYTMPSRFLAEVEKNNYRIFNSSEEW